MTSWTMFILNIFSSFLTEASGSTCFSYDSVVHQGKYLPRHVYRQVDATTVFDCASLCKRSTVCKSFNFDTDHRSCYLNSVGSNVVILEDRSNVVSSDIKDWPENVAGSCMSEVCTGNTICTVDRLHRAKCEPEFPGCGSPPTFPPASSVYDGHYLGADVGFTCNDGYVSCHTSCLATSQWDDINAACVINTWENVDGVWMCLSGSASSSSWRTVLQALNIGVRINLMKGSDILFHAVANHESQLYAEHLMVADSLIDGTWSGAILHKPVEVLVGQVFIIEIKLTGGIYALMLDGAEIISYPEKKSGVSPDKLRLTSDALQIHSLEIRQ